MRKPQIYKMRDHSRQYLVNHGFYFKPELSNDDSTIYVHRFPVYKWGSVCTLECEFLVIIETGEVQINVFDYNTRYKYASWYINDSTSEIVPEIDKKIDEEMRRLKIKKGK